MGWLSGYLGKQVVALTNDQPFIRRLKALMGVGGGIPSQTGQSGKVLGTDGTDFAWVTDETGLPDQTGHGGEFLTTDGSNAAWAPAASDLDSVLANGDTATDKDAIIRTTTGTHGYYTKVNNITVGGLESDGSAGGTLTLYKSNGTNPFVISYNAFNFDGLSLVPGNAGTIAVQSDISDVIVQTVTDGDTTHAPSGDAVFDAIAAATPATPDLEAVLNAGSTTTAFKNIVMPQSTITVADGSISTKSHQISNTSTVHIITITAPIVSASRVVTFGDYPGEVTINTAAQALINKTIDGNNNTLTVLAASQLSGLVPGANGGTGVANTGKTITVSGNTIIGSSTNTVAFTTSGNTSVALPTSGTLAKTTDYTLATVLSNGASSPTNITLTGGAGLILDNSASFGGTATFLPPSSATVTLTSPGSSGILVTTGDLAGYQTLTGLNYISTTTTTNNSTSNVVLLGPGNTKTFAIKVTYQGRATSSNRVAGGMVMAVGKTNGSGTVTIVGQTVMVAPISDFSGGAPTVAFSASTTVLRFDITSPAADAACDWTIKAEYWVMP